MSIVSKMIAEYSSAQENGLDANAAWECAVEIGEAAERAALAQARQTALEEAAQISEQYKKHYPESVFTPDGTSVDAQSARCMRVASDNIAADIRKAAEETDVGLHAAQ